MNSTIILSKAQAFRYLGFIIGIIFMILSVRVYVNNYLTIQHSIAQTQQSITRTQSETDFIKNFQLPYLQTALAQRNLMHRQQMIEPGGKIVFFTYPAYEPRPTTPPSTTQESITPQGWSNFIKYQRQRSIAN